MCRLELSVREIYEIQHICGEAEAVTELVKSHARAYKPEVFRLNAAVCHQGNGYRTVCIGFPIETFKQDESLDKIISTTLEFFRK